MRPFLQNDTRNTTPDESRTLAHVPAANPPPATGHHDMGPGIRYRELEPRLHTGDLLLFHGASRRSRIIETATGSTFSHIGMIVRPEPGDAPLLWHTDPRAVTEDVVDEREHGGAQLNDLARALAVMTSPEYGDTPYVRQLLVAHRVAFDEAALRAVLDANATRFPSMLKILKKWVLGHLRIASRGERMYCAEVLALTYQRMGLLPPEPPPNAYAPRDFSAQHMNLHLLQGATLGPQMRVLWDGAAASA